MRILGWIATAIVGFGFASASAGARDATGTGPAPLGGAAVLDEWVVQIEKLVVPAAEAMPEDRYSFAPTVGEFAGVRTFAEQVKHLAAANWQLGSRVLGENPPAGTQDETAPPSIRTKAQILEYLHGSFACLHRAAAASSGERLTEPIAATAGVRQRTRMWLLIDAFAHSSNHYGQMVEYLRMNGIVPPESATAKQDPPAPQCPAATAAAKHESPKAGPSRCE